MSERSVSVVDDSDSRIIESIGVSGSATESMIDPDEFAKPANTIKSMGGTSPVFKRRITNEIKKYQRGVDGAETKQIVEKEMLTGYDAFDVVLPPYNLDYLARLYELSAPHYAAVNAKVANIVGLGYKLTENAVTKRNFERLAGNTDRVANTRRRLDQHRDDVLNSLESLNEEDTFTEVLVKVWRDYEVTGNGYIEIGRKMDGTIGYLGHIPAQTIRIRRKRDGFVQISGFAVQFFANYGHGDEPNPIGNDKPNEIIHIKKYSPTSGYYGIPDIVAAKQAVAGNEFAARFNLDYFENKAVPRHLITLKGARLGAHAEAQLLGFFENMKGQNHRSLFIPLPPDTTDSKVEFKITPIESGVQDASFTNYRKANLSDILMAHRVPLTKISVSDAASLAIAKDADKTFKEQVCAPEQRIFEKKLNRMMSEFTDAFDIKLNEMTLTDEDAQSQIFDRYRKDGVMTANEVRMALGMTTLDGGNELFDMNAAKQSTARQGVADATANRQRDATRTANATDSAGNARNPKGEGRTTP